MDERELGELCEECELRYLTVWRVPNDIWEFVSGHIDGSGLLCPSCFETKARGLDLILCWECSPDWIERK